VIARQVDFPPVWLAGFAALGGGIGLLRPVLFGYSYELGGMLIVLALIVMAVAVVQMLARRTTIMPHQSPSRIVSGGIFRFSRNPIYLADAVLLTGLYIYWGALIALPLVAVFMVVIKRRFIVPEEHLMLRKFGTEYRAYAARTRRWL
jgi:protein-S-isoprenylcysteine O-methyltransferase Ste14